MRKKCKAVFHSTHMGDYRNEENMLDFICQKICRGFSKSSRSRYLQSFSLEESFVKSKCINFIFVGV